MLNRLLLLTACIALAISLILSIGYAYDRTPNTQVPTYEHGTRGTKITEDDPRWNCHTMGNHICGNNR